MMLQSNFIRHHEKERKLSFGSYVFGEKYKGFSAIKGEQTAQWQFQCSTAAAKE